MNEFIIWEDNEVVCGCFDVHISPQNSLIIQIAFLVVNDSL